MRGEKRSFAARIRRYWLVWAVATPLFCVTLVSSFAADGDATDIIHYPSLSDEGLLVEQAARRRALEAAAHRRQLIGKEDCPLSLFFSTSFGGETPPDQLQSIPEHCRGIWQHWKRAATQQDEARLIASESKTVIERAEDFDDTARGQVKIDADGLAWLIEYVPPTEIAEPESYVILQPNGMRYTITDETKVTITRTEPRFKRTLLPQYSRPEALAKWQEKVGRGLASDTPEYEEAH